MYVPRWQRVQFRQTATKKVMFSPIKKKMVVYSKCQGLISADFFEYPLSSLKAAYNEELAKENIDAYVEECRKVRGMYEDHLITDMWVATESPLAPAVVAAIIFIIKMVAVTVAAIYILSAASSFVETILPKSHFYAPDGKEFTDLASYITYMKNVYNPSEGYPYTCPYCGQGFATEEELEKHMESCPWKSGPPTPTADIWMYIIIAIAGIGAIVIIPKVLDLLKGKGG